MMSFGQSSIFDKGLNLKVLTHVPYLILKRGLERTEDLL